MRYVQYATVAANYRSLKHYLEENNRQDLLPLVNSALDQLTADKNDRVDADLVLQHAVRIIDAIDDDFLGLKLVKQADYQDVPLRRIFSRVASMHSHQTKLPLPPALFITTLQRYLSLATEAANLRVELSQGTAELILTPWDSNTPNHHQFQGLVLACYQITLMHSQCQVLSVTLDSASRAEDATQYQHYFDADVHFTPDRYALTVAIDDPTSNSLNDAIELYTQLETAQRIISSDYSYSERAQSLMAQCLFLGTPTREQFAKIFGISVRTLQRKLANEGHQFFELVDKTRQRIALQLKSEGQLNNIDIAFMLGYKDPSAYYKAQRSWAAQEKSE